MVGDKDVFTRLRVRWKIVRGPEEGWEEEREEEEGRFDLLSFLDERREWLMGMKGALRSSISPSSSSPSSSLSKSKVRLSKAESGGSRIKPEEDEGCPVPPCPLRCCSSSSSSSVEV